MLETWSYGTTLARAHSHCKHINCSMSSGDVKPDIKPDIAAGISLKLKDSSNSETLFKVKMYVASWQHRLFLHRVALTSLLPPP